MTKKSITSHAKRKTLLIVFSITLVGLVGRLSNHLDWTMVKAQGEERYAELQSFSKVLNLIQQYYVEEVDSKKLIYGAIKGMLRELDPHTNFLPPDLFKDFETETAGEFGGLGVEVSIQSGVLTIISPIEDAPAWEAGVKAGDKIIAIDGNTTKGLSLVETSLLMRGKLGTKIMLTIVREGQAKPFDITIVRGNVKIKSVKFTDLENGYLYVKVTSFIDNTAKDLEKALVEEQKKYSSIKGLILDLRRNPGGLLDQAIKVGDLFLSNATIVSTIGRDPNSKEIAMTTNRSKFSEFPIVVLLNEFSASASEIVAGALQDNHRAIIMGQRSFGKGSVQSVIKLGDGSGLKLTVARYYTPSGRSIQSEGIIPDIEVEDIDFESFSKSIIKNKAQREKDINGHLLSENEKLEKNRHKNSNSKEGNLTAWWTHIDSKKEETKSPREKLITGDYQIYQAFNYIKGWQIMSGLKQQINSQ